MKLTKRMERHLRMEHGHLPDEECEVGQCSECSSIFYLCVPHNKLFIVDGKKYCKDCAFDLYHQHSGEYDKFTGKRKGDK